MTLKLIGVVGVKEIRIGLSALLSLLIVGCTSQPEKTCAATESEMQSLYDMVTQLKRQIAVTEAMYATDEQTPKKSIAPADSKSVTHQVKETPLYKRTELIDVPKQNEPQLTAPEKPVVAKHEEVVKKESTNNIAGADTVKDKLAYGFALPPLSEYNVTSKWNLIDRDKLVKSYDPKEDRAKIQLKQGLELVALVTQNSHKNLLLSNHEGVVWFRYPNESDRVILKLKNDSGGYVYAFLQQ
jgi:hypothetical protein